MGRYQLDADHRIDRSPGDLRDRVLAILVITGEQPWHDALAARLAERGAESIEGRLLVVDNGGAPTAPVIAEALSAPLVSLPHALTFGGAVAAAVTAPAAGDPASGEPEFLLLLHDDLLLDEGALAAMVEVMDRREDVAVTGPKLLEWRREPVLQQVGMTIDALGRAESHLHDDEVDQGQHDHRAETLYVSSAGMLVRSRVFFALHGFDPRFAALRDDLDLCWRAWLAGHEVEVVPEAVGWHLAAAARSVRQRGVGRRATTRYLAERHTLAAMLKNLGVLRLVWTLPLYGLLALARALGFLLTRRVALAAAPIAAVAWNVRSLPGTLRLRRLVQRSRQRSDPELADLFAHTSWRTRAYVDAFGDWLRGVNTRALVGDGAAPRAVRRPGRSGWWAPVDALRDHSAAIVGTALLAVWLVAVLPLLGGGQLIGGQVAAWPQDAAAFWNRYAAGWGLGPLATGAIGSPIQPVLGLLGALVGGGAWAAQRLVVLGLVPVIWLVTLRAGRLITASPVPRVVGATLYAASPLVLGSFAQGRLDVLTIAAALPAALLLAARASRAGTRWGEAGPMVAPVSSGASTSPGKADDRAAVGRAWRASALLAVVAAVGLSVAPTAWPVLLLPVLGVAGVGWLRRAGRPAVLLRVLVAVLGTVALLGPWLLALWSDDTGDPVGTAAAAAPTALSLWQAFIGYSDLLPGVDAVLDAPVEWLWIAAAVAAVATAVVFALRRRATAVLALSGAMVAFGGAAALVARQPAPALWPPMAALPALLALAGLAVVGVRSVPPILREHRAGVRHVVAVLAGVALLAGPGGVLAQAVAVDEWPALRRDPQVLPLFVQADAERLGPYRVLLLEGDGNEIRWWVTEPGAPRMTAFGSGTSQAVTEALDNAVAGLLAGDRMAAGSAGALNVRYLVLRDAQTREAVAPALADLPAVEPLAAGDGTVYQLRTWLPRSAVLPPGVLQTALAGEPVDADTVEAAALQRVAADRFVGGPTGTGTLLVSEAADPAWRASADGRPLEPVAGAAGDLPVSVYAVDRPVEGLEVVAEAGARPWWLAWQALVLLVLLSLALRAPGRTAGPAAPAPTAVPGAPPERVGQRVPVGAGVGGGGSHAAFHGSGDAAGDAPSGSTHTDAPGPGVRRE